MKINVLISRQSKFNQFQMRFDLINIIKDLANLIFKEIRELIVYLIILFREFNLI